MVQVADVSAVDARMVVQREGGGEGVRAAGAGGQRLRLQGKEGEGGPAGEAQGKAEVEVDDAAAPRQESVRVEGVESEEKGAVSGSGWYAPAPGAAPGAQEGEEEGAAP